MLIGLTGGYCAGKNLAASFLEAEGYAVLDVDTLGHAAIGAERERIIGLFGESFRSPDGEVDRRALGRRVFGDRAALAALEGIVHPAANRMAEEWLESRSGGKLCLNAALLHRMPAIERLDFVLELWAPLLPRLRRAMKRDGLGVLPALARIRAQRDFPRLLRASGRPVLRVANSGGPAALRAALLRALEAGEGL